MPSANVSPVKQAKRLLGASFLDDLEAHLLGGVVISTPTEFLMGRPVPYRADVLDAWEQWPTEDCSAWYVWAGIGDPLRLLNLMPWPLPWVGWSRIGRDQREIHWYRTERLRERLTRVPPLETGKEFLPILRNSVESSAHGRLTQNSQAICFVEKVGGAANRSPPTAT